MNVKAGQQSTSLRTPGTAEVSPSPAPQKADWIQQVEACPRCGGHFFWERDQYGEYLNCLQCGHNSNITPAKQRTGRSVRPFLLFP